MPDLSRLLSAIRGCLGVLHQLRLRSAFFNTNWKRPSLKAQRDGPQQQAIGITLAAMLYQATVRAPRLCSHMRRPCRFQVIIPQWSCRPYSIQSQEEDIARLPDINLDALSITKATTPKPVLPPEELVFGRTFTGKHATAFPHSKTHFVLRNLCTQIICSRSNGRLHKAGSPPG